MCPPIVLNIPKNFYELVMSGVACEIIRLYNDNTPRSVFSGYYILALHIMVDFGKVSV